MSLDYSIAAIPTLYNGRQYRSRLEARWAAFFDQLGIEHEYEPFDLGGWSPDFLLPSLSTLVEVKPLTEIDEAVWDKMASAASKRAKDACILLTSVSPVGNSMLRIGWAGRGPSFNYETARLVWIPGEDYPHFIADILLIEEGLTWWTARGAEGDQTNCYWLHPYGEHAKQLWAKATNAAQWEGPK